MEQREEEDKRTRVSSWKVRHITIGQEKEKVEDREKPAIQY